MQLSAENSPYMSIKHGLLQPYDYDKDEIFDLKKPVGLICRKENLR